MDLNYSTVQSAPQSYVRIRFNFPEPALESSMGLPKTDEAEEDTDDANISTKIKPVSLAARFDCFSDNSDGE
jgi:hypothetical protein